MSTASGSPPTSESADPITAAAHSAIQAAWPEAVEEVVLEGRHPFVRIRPGALRPVCALLRDHPDLLMDCLHLITGVDYPARQQIDVLYHLCSYSRPPPPGLGTRPLKNDPWVCLKVRLPRESPEVETIMDLFTGADWHERETWDLVGVRFTGRGELSRILLPEDWPGHPLRKDWELPASYHGVPIIAPEDM